MTPALLILAAGIGSRYGGIKQLDHIGPNGETLLDYSIYDAIRAGFSKIVFIIKEDLEKDFREVFIDRLSKFIEVDYVFQEIRMVPDGIRIPEARKKPWGTGHAVLLAGDRLSGPFAVINADDFYGRKAYEVLADYYRGWSPIRENDYCMAGYHVDKTLSEFGSVSRGICKVNRKGELVDVVERTSISGTSAGIVYREGNEPPVTIPADSVVSMNFWGFTPSFFTYLTEGFGSFIRVNHESLKAEFYIPTMVNQLIKSKRVNVKVLSCDEQWFGMTYKEDREFVAESIRSLIQKGVYPQKLWV